MMLSYLLVARLGVVGCHVRPLIPERMPVLVDDDLCFEDGAGAPRPTTVVNRWLRAAAGEWVSSAGFVESYARVLLEWMRFLDEHGVALFDSRARLKGALSRYAEHRATGPVEQRFAGYDLGAAHECAVGVLPVGYRRKLRHGTAVHLPNGAGVVRGHRP